MTVKRFGWKDRDTAAEDFLQLAYHGPDRVRLTALDILRAIRSEKIIPDLKAIVLEQEWVFWERVLALRAITSVRADIYIPEFAILAENDLLSDKALENRFKILRQDFLTDIQFFVESHPSNEQWFWSVLNRSDPLIVASYIDVILHRTISLRWREKLSSYIITLIDRDPTLISLSLIHTFYTTSNQDHQQWLRKYMDRIVDMCLTLKDDDPNYVWSLPFNWPELTEALNNRDAGFLTKWETKKANWISSSKYEANKREQYQHTAVWRKLQALYTDALNGNNQAFSLIKNLTRRHKLNVSVRAAATHFLGRLQSKYPIVTKHLSTLLQHDETEFEYTYHPVRFEAGSALKDIPTPQIWEVFTNAMFMSPDNMLSSYMLDWISNITDILSGLELIPEKDDSLYEPSWFTALVDITDSLEDLGLA